MAITEEKRALLLEEQQLLAEDDALLAEEERLLSQEDTGLERGERSAIGNVFERPAATSRAAIQANPLIALQNPMLPQLALSGLIGLSGLGGPEAQQAAQKGAQFPEEVPRFQDLWIKRGQEVGPPSQSTAVNFLKGLPGSAGGLALDIATSPADTLLAMIGQTPVGGGKTLGTAVAKSGVGQAVGKVAKAEIAPRKAISNLVSRFKVDFVNENMFPRIANIFAEKVELWGKGVQSFAERTPGIKMPKNMVGHIGKRTVNAIRKSRTALNDSLDDVATSIKQAFQGKIDTFQQVYDDAFRGIDNSAKINIEDAYGQMRRVLFKNGFVDKTGNLTKRAADPLQNPALRKLSSEYKFLSQKIGPEPVQLFGPKGEALAPTVPRQRLAARGVNKNEWNNFKNAISEVTTIDPSKAPDIVRISDALHIQAENAGLKGVSKGRQLFRKHMEHIDTFKKVSSEEKLAGVFKSGQKARDIATVDNYLGTNALQQSQDIVAGRSLQQIDDIGIIAAGQKESLLRNQLKSAADPKNIKSVKRDFFENLWGKDAQVDKIFKEIGTTVKTRKVAGIAVGAATAAALFKLTSKAIRSALPDSNIQGGGG